VWWVALGVIAKRALMHTTIETMNPKVGAYAWPFVLGLVVTFPRPASEDIILAVDGEENEAVVVV
jgi:hypothetical protein